MNMRRRYIVAVAFLTILVIALWLFSVSSGRFAIPLDQIVAVMTGNTDGVSVNVRSIVLNSRIPRAVGAVLAGLALSSSGAAYQSVFRNPMATPDILGVASGAACGAAIGILIDLPDALVQVSAFIMGLVALALAYSISRIVSKGNDMVVFLVLVGLVVGALFESAIMVAKFFADVDNTLPAITFWLMGGLSGVTPEKVALVTPVIVIGSIALNAMRWKLNLISFDDDEAASMGVNVRRTRFTVVLIATFVSAAAVSMCGLVGWVGIIVPHCARLFIGSNNRYMVPIATLSGAAFMLVVDDVARMMLSVEVPLGVLTALVGAPIFLWLLLRSNMIVGDR